MQWMCLHLALCAYGAFLVAFSLWPCGCVPLCQHSLLACCGSVRAIHVILHPTLLCILHVEAFNNSVNNSMCAYACMCLHVLVYIYIYIFMHIVLPLSIHVQQSLSLRARALTSSMCMQLERARERETLSVTHCLSHSQSLSSPLALLLSLTFALSLSLACSSCLCNQDGIDGSCRLVLRERANV